jgi:hypothetical protein
MEAVSTPVTSQIPMTLYDATPQKTEFITLNLEAASTSETSVNFCEYIKRKFPEDSHLHAHRFKNLKSHNMKNLHSLTNTVNMLKCIGIRQKRRVWTKNFSRTTIWKEPLRTHRRRWEITGMDPKRYLRETGS